jgi:hypothetical protein
LKGPEDRVKGGPAGIVMMEMEQSFSPVRVNNVR